MITIMPSNLIFGSQDLSACCVQLPNGVKRWRIRTSNKGFATIFLRFDNRVEYWVLERVDDLYLRPKHKQREIRIA